MVSEAINDAGNRLASMRRRSFDHQRRIQVTERAQIYKFQKESSSLMKGVT
jgi:hypothetical protein